MRKQQTKKQARRSSVSSLTVGLIFALGAIGFTYWDYREQIKFYNLWERGSGLDFKTGKPIPNYQPPPFKYTYDKMMFLPYIAATGAVSLIMLLLAASDFRRASKIIETPEMRERDAKLEAIANLPEMKRYARDVMTLRLAPIVVMIPVPFFAVYKFGVYFFLVYITFAAVFVGALHVYLPRKK